MKIVKRGLFTGIAAILTFLLFSQYACDDFKSKEFEISEQDQRACSQITDTLYKPLVLKNLTVFDSTWVDSNVTLYVPRIIDSLVTHDLVVSETDTADTVYTLTNNLINYVAFLPLHAGVVFYLDQAVDLVLINENGNLINPSNTNMPYATMAGCQGINNISKAVEPVIKTRLEFGTNEERYLLMLVKSDQTKSSRIKTAVLPM